MSDTLTKAKKLFEDFPLDFPLRFDDMGSGETHGFRPGIAVGKISSSKGQAAVVPVQESNAMIAGYPKVFRMLTEAPNLLKALIEESEQAK